MPDESYYYKITMGGRDSEHPISGEDLKRVGDSLKSRGYNLTMAIKSETIIAAKIEPKMNRSDIESLKGICTIVEDEDMAIEMRHI